MAKKKAAEKQIIRVTDLAEEFGIPPNKVRMFVRSLGLKAPETNIEGFGPKTKYEWEEGSKELKLIREAWSQYQEEKEARGSVKTKEAAKKTKKKTTKKKPEPEPEPEEEDEEDEDDLVDEQEADFEDDEDE